jgi:hypothetical protein
LCAIRSGSSEAYCISFIFFGLPTQAENWLTPMAIALFWRTRAEAQENLQVFYGFTQVPGAIL